MKIGCHLPMYGPVGTRDNVIAFARRIEALGYDSLWASDHVVLPHRMTTPYPYNPTGQFPLAPDVPFLSFLLFLGAAMSVTAFPVLARILSERHLLTSRVGAIAIACAAVDDVTAWCILAFVVAVARSTGVAGACWTTAFALLFIVTMVWVVRPVLRRLGARVPSREGLTGGHAGGQWLGGPRKGTAELAGPDSEHSEAGGASARW